MKRLGILSGLFGMFLSGCALQQHPVNQVESKNGNASGRYSGIYNYRENNYNPSDFKLPASRDPIAVVTSESFGDNPALLSAYHQYLATGTPKNIQGKGIETLAYSPYDQPLITCAPLQLCQIILAKDEKINAITTADPSRWQIQSSFIGEKKIGSGSWVVMLKPSEVSMTTSLTITTDKRIYRFAITSKEGVSSQTINFWYPQDTLNYVTEQAKMSYNKALKEAQNIDTSYQIDLAHLNNDYNYTSPNKPVPVWLPESVFDDGSKTYIKLPPVSGKVPQPIFSTVINGEESVTNYRYKAPYIIYDGIFKEAVLISGNGNTQEKVNLINKAYPGQWHRL